MENAENMEVEVGVVWGSQGTQNIGEIRFTLAVRSFYKSTVVSSEHSVSRLELLTGTRLKVSKAS